MKKAIFTSILLIFLNTYTYSQSCLPSGITFTTQQQIDDFAANYPGCTEIEGDVSIEEFTFGNIINLNGLSQLTTISGSLNINDNPALASLSGLDNLTSIFQDLNILDNSGLTSLSGLGNFASCFYLNIINNDALASLSGLDNLTSFNTLTIQDNEALTSLFNMDQLTSNPRINIINNDALTNLSGLDNITSFNTLTIQENDVLTSLSGLNNLTSVGNDLNILDNDALTSLSGLDNLTSIGRHLKIISNSTLASLSGLNNLTTIGSGLYIQENAALTNLSNLDNLTSIGRYLYIQDNAALTSLSGLNNITSISRYLTIYNNDALISLSGLNNITSIGLNLRIANNAVLTSLSGLDNLTFIGEYLGISGNDALMSLSGLDNLTSIEGYFNLSYNDALTSLAALSNLTSIGGPLSISKNTALTSFSGLDNLTSISGLLRISKNPVLTSLSGLANLTSIAGELTIQENSVLTSISALENLISIGGHLNLHNNPSLISLNGLDNLTSIGGYINISYNHALTSLTGIHNIDPTSIVSQNPIYEDLVIYRNTLLSECEVQSICDFLDLPNKTTDISGNSTGCKSISEIEEACNPSLPPTCTTLSTPTDGSSNIYINTDLMWASIPEATGYKLTIGTITGGNDLYDNEDVGNITTFDPVDFPCATTIYVTITPYNDSGDAIACQEAAFTTEEITASAGDDVSICAGSSTQLNASGGTVYSWSPGNGLDDPNISNPIASPTSTTSYTVTVSTGNGCEDIDEVTVTVNDNPTPSIMGDNSICEGESTEFDAGSGYTLYAWSNGESSQTITISVTNTYTLTVTDGNMCTGAVSRTLTINPNPVANASASDETANNANDGTAEANPTGGTEPYSYEWSNGGTAQTITNLAPNTYTVNVLDANTCSTEETVVVEEFPCPEIAIELALCQTVFYGYSPEECIELTPAVSNGNEPYQYMWSTGETTPSIEVCPQSASEYSLTITDADGCTAEVLTEVEVIDVRCGNKMNKVEICHNDNTLCVSPNAVQAHLAHGDQIGSCDNGDPCIQEFQIIINNNSSNRLSDVILYPNPVKDYLLLVIPDHSLKYNNYSVINTLGQLMITNNIGGIETEIDISDMQSGIYYLILAGGDDQLIKKFQVQK